MITLPRLGFDQANSLWLKNASIDVVAEERKIRKGEGKGHAFRGNQYTGGIGLSSLKTLASKNGVRLKIQETSTALVIENIVADSKGGGRGTKVIEAVKAYANTVGKDVKLVADGGGTPRDERRLVQWYKRLGFVEDANGELSYQGAKTALITEGTKLYHVTRVANAKSIQDKGLLPMQTSNWVKAGNKDRYGEGDVFAFTSEKDAIRWAAKMDWEFNKKMGSGEIAVVSFTHDGKTPWREDDADPLSQAGKDGTWLRAAGSVPAKQIQSVTPITNEDVRRVIMAKGEGKGHAFRGNQYTGGLGGSSDNTLPHSVERAKLELGRLKSLGFTMSRSASVHDTLVETSVEDMARMWHDRCPKASPMELLKAVFGPDLDVKEANIAMKGDGIIFMDGGMDSKMYGAKIDAIERTFDFDTMTAGHDFIRLQESDRGGGAVKEMFRNVIPLYQKMGMDRVTAYANLESGGYVWGRYGFRADEPSEYHRIMKAGIDRFHKELIDNLGEIGGKASAEYDSIQRILKDHKYNEAIPVILSGVRTPNLDNALTAIGRSHSPTNGKTLTFLQRSMYKEMWHGHLDLNSKEQLTPLATYIGVQVDSLTKSAVSSIKGTPISKADFVGIMKFNPYHDEKGRFATKDTAASVDHMGLAIAGIEQKQREFAKNNQKGIRFDAVLEGETPDPKQVIEYLEMMSRFQKSAKFMLQEGELMTVPDSPPDVTLGTPKQCFKNSTNFVLHDFGDRYRYVEGTWQEVGSIPIDHAWVLDTKTNTVIDPTLGWRPKSVYFGIPVDNKFLLKKMSENMFYGLISNGEMYTKFGMGIDPDYRSRHGQT